MREFFGRLGSIFGSGSPEGKEQPQEAGYEGLIREFVLKGTMGPNELAGKLNMDRADEFRETFSRLLPELEQAVQTPAQQFKINQIETMINQGLEAKIGDEQGIPYIKKAA